MIGRGAATTASVLLAALSLGLTWWLPSRFLYVWVAYLILATSYSLALKRVVVMDVVVLGALYTARVLAGAAVVQVPLSRWFLAFAVFLFSALAFMKRMVETIDLESGNGMELPGRGWTVRDRPVLLGLGAACSAASALVYCLYITSDAVYALYGRPDLLWLGLPVGLYWLGRAWLVANRGEMHEDPLVFTLRDGTTYGVMASLALILWLAS